LKQHRIKSWSYRLPALEILDGLTVFYIALGFLFWLAGLSLGAVQAFQVWNHLPLEDPKILVPSWYWPFTPVSSFCAGF